MKRELPVVSVVGRPNVGKSTLFNRLLKKKAAIVDDQAGVTRDSKYETLTWNRKSFYLADTGGLIPKTDDIFQELIDEQVYHAISISETIVFLLDYITGVTDVDLHIAKKQKEYSKTRTIIIAVNKADDPTDMTGLYDFYKLGLGDPHLLSATHGIGIGDLLDEITASIGRFKIAFRDDDSIKVAIVGKPNVGKSSMMNRLIGEEKVIVSDVSGTTRDPIDTFIRVKGKEYRLIDTAGIKREKKLQSLEYYSVIRTKKVVWDCDVMIFMIDASRPIDNQDEEVINVIANSGRPIVGVINKWDIVENKESNTLKGFIEDFKLKFPNLRWVPMISTSAKTGLRVENVFDQIEMSMKNWKKSIGGQELKDFFHQITQVHYHPPVQNKQIRFVKIKQTGTKPPTFDIYVNWPELVKQDYKRFINNKIRSMYDLTGTPLKFIFKRSKDGEEATVEDYL